jgi:uroporphyrinogen-III decarboxylase
MDRSFYFDLARRGLRMPIGADLLLHENPAGEVEAIRRDGERLGRVVADAAKRYRTPLAIPLMDLTREKAALLESLDMVGEAESFHFVAVPDARSLEHFERSISRGMPEALRPQVDAVRFIAQQTDLVPVGMTIGPFSLLTKLLGDPITPVYLAGAGATAADEPEVRLLDELLELATRLVCRAAQLQIEAGAKLLVVAEPAANKVYFSPAQVEKPGNDVFERYAMRANRRLRGILREANVQLFFHCCGELSPAMLRAFCSLDPAILSLGSGRVLWEDAAVVPRTTILFGNLPSKQFYSDALITVDDVARRSRELLRRMRRVDHPFILGSECDVLNVPGCEQTIRAKVQAMIDAEVENADA